jgi:hypothetical protein
MYKINNKYDVGYWVVVTMLLLTIFFSCSPLRHYKKVANDIPRSEAKRAILAPICANEFPVKEITDTVVEYSTIADSTKIIQLKRIIKEMQRELEQRPECPQIDADSLYQVILSTIPKDTIVKSKIITRIVEDSSKLKIAETKYNELLQDFYKLDATYIATDKQLKELQDNVDSNSFLLKKLFAKNWWWILAILVVIGLYFYIRNNNAVLKNILNKLK